MAHMHDVTDQDTHFLIDTETRKISNETNTKVTLVQFDHNSEILTFEMPRTVEGHDMAECDEIRVHYINISKNRKKQKEGVYEVQDKGLSEDEQNIRFSWLISRNATEIAGSLNFLICFSCISEQIDYAWNTEICRSISVSDGMNNSEVIEEEYFDILEQWKQKLFGIGNTEEQKIKEVYASEKNTIEKMVAQATDAKNAAVGYANTASNKADEAEADRLETAQIKAQAEELRQETEKLRQDTLAAEQRVIQLMSTDTKSYFFATIAERDAATGIRQCDRCSVYETRADYIYDTQNIDGDEENPEWIKTSDWDALKSVAWDIITGKPDFAKVALSGKYADLIGIPNRYQSPLVLDGTGETVVWNYSEGDTAVVTLTESKPLEINGAYNGCVAVVQCYGAVLDLSDEIYNKSITFGYIEPLEAEHITYTLIYNAGKWDVTSLVYAGGEAGA